MAMAARAGDGMQVVRPGVWVPERLQRARRAWTPRTDLGRFVRLCADELARFGRVDEAAELIERFSRTLVLGSRLEGVAHVWNERLGLRVAHDLGLLSERVITTVGVGFLVDAWQNIVELEIMKYHALGTGTNAEAVGDTALQTELTTEYTGNVRATGTLAEGAANVFVTVGANVLDAGTPAVTEHGILSQAATGGGVLWDRSVFAAINLVGANGDGLTTTYSMTATAGG